MGLVPLSGGDLCTFLHMGRLGLKEVRYPLKVNLRQKKKKKRKKEISRDFVSLVADYKHLG